MKIEVAVKNRLLVINDTYRIPSGSMNDCHIAFHFEPGYGWDELDITAVFTRVEGQRVYRTGIKPDTYVSIPAGILNRPGNIFVGLVGCKGGDVVVTSTTVTLTVEANVLNVLNPCTYPVNELGELDNDAYAQYVASVNAAAVRAELAADKLECATCGYYTKEESDLRFAKRVKLQANAEKEFDASTAIPDTIPEILVEAVGVESVAGNVSSPAPLHSIDAVRVEVSNGNTKESTTYSGFTLRKLSDTVKDSLVVCAKGAFKYERVYELKVGNADGAWLDGFNYAVSLVTAPNIASEHIGSIITNIGDVPMTVDETKIVFHFTAKPTDDELKNIAVWYPLENMVVTPISTVAPGKVLGSDSNIKVYKTVNTVEAPLDLFRVMVELDVTKYLNTYNETLTTLEDEIAALKEHLKNMWHKLNGVAVAMSLEIKPEDWDEGASPYEFTVQIDNLGVVPHNCRRAQNTAAAALNPGIIPIDLRQVDPETGFADSFACQVVEIDQDTVELRAIGIVPNIMARFTYFAYK